MSAAPLHSSNQLEGGDTMLRFFQLFAGWSAFVFAVVNTVNAVQMYIVRDSGSYGVEATIRWLLFGLAFAVWDHLVIRRK